MSIKDIQDSVQSRMEKTIDAFKAELAQIRTGRANPGLLEHVMVSYYGVDTPLSQVASVNASDARTLAITVWEKDNVSAVEKAIMTSDLGLNPSVNGNVVRVPLPALTEERRKELTKVVHSEAEKARVSLRNIRRHANEALKDTLKAKDISEDDERRAQDTVQKTTDKFVAQIDDLLKAKEEDLMQV